MKNQEIEEPILGKNNSSVTNSGIPRIIHQIWFQGQTEIPSKYISFQKGWIDNHQDYLYRFWDENSIASLISQYYAWYFEIWKILPHMIQKIDSAKIFILHAYGGVVVDMDMESLITIEPLLTSPLIFSRCYVHPVAIAGAAIMGLKYFAKTRINNGFIACSRGHSVMWNTIRLLQYTSLNAKSIEFRVYIAKSCGTEVMIEGLAQELKKNPNLQYDVYPSEFFEPKVKIRNRKPLITKNTRVIHHSDRSWVRDSPVAKFQFFVFFILCAIVLGLVIAVTIVILKKYQCKQIVQIRKLVSKGTNYRRKKSKRN